MPVSFTRPVIGPRDYLAIGSSGWGETFNRKKADEALRAYLAPHGVAPLVLGFLARMSGRVTEWGDVLGYLREIAGREDEPPTEAAVAFWATVNAAREQK